MMYPTLIAFLVTLAGCRAMIQADPRGDDDRVGNILFDSMTMRRSEVGGMAGVGMAITPNGIPTVGGIAPRDEITMGGAFTILEVREDLSNHDENPGWYDDPPATPSSLSSGDAHCQNTIANDGGLPPRAPAAKSRVLPVSDAARSPAGMPRGWRGGHGGGL